MDSVPGTFPVVIGARPLQGFAAVPPAAKGLIIFAHGSGSGRFSPRNHYVAKGLQEAGFATLLLDLLTEEEEADRSNVFDIALLAERLAEAASWSRNSPIFQQLPIGYFGASTGAGAAVFAAARGSPPVDAVVCRGGRPDLAEGALPHVAAPTLLLVGSRDTTCLALNRSALDRMRCPRELVVVPGASHLFEEPGTLDRVIAESSRWFGRWLGKTAGSSVRLPLADRRFAGRLLAERLQEFKSERPLVLALPRGGVPVAYEVARALDAELDILLVRKLRAPAQPELGIGAIVDGADPQIVLNRDVMDDVRPSSAYLRNEVHAQLAEIARRREEYLGDRSPAATEGRCVILVDDGIATGGTVKAALRGLKKTGVRKLILAVPVAPAERLGELAAECDEMICLAAPDPFRSVGVHYSDFAQTSDAEVKQLLAAAARPAHAEQAA